MHKLCSHRYLSSSHFRLNLSRPHFLLNSPKINVMIRMVCRKEHEFNPSERWQKEHILAWSTQKEVQQTCRVQSERKPHFKKTGTKHTGKALFFLPLLGAFFISNWLFFSSLRPTNRANESHKTSATREVSVLKLFWCNWPSLTKWLPVIQPKTDNGIDYLKSVVSMQTKGGRNVGGQKTLLSFHHLVFLDHLKEWLFKNVYGVFLQKGIH